MCEVGNGNGCGKGKECSPLLRGEEAKRECSGSWRNFTFNVGTILVDIARCLDIVQGEKGF